MALDPINRPLDVIDELYNFKKDESDQCVDVTRLGERILFQKLINVDQTFLRNIPLLSNSTISSLSPGSLCRYRGLVQDICSTEIYCGIFAQGRDEREFFFKYQDAISESTFDDDDQFSSLQMCERQPFVMIPVPGEAPWVDIHFPSIPPATDEDSDFSSLDPSRDSSLLRKRRLEALSGVTESEQPLKSPRNMLNTISTYTGELETPGTDSPSSDIESLSPADRCPRCLVVVYDDLGHAFRMNDVVEVIGVFYPAPASEDDNESSSTGTGAPPPFARANLVDISDTWPESDAGATSTAAQHGDGFDEEEGSGGMNGFNLKLPRVHAILTRKLFSSFPLIVTPRTSLVVPVDTSARVVAADILLSLWITPDQATHDSIIDVVLSRCIDLNSPSSSSSSPSSSARQQQLAAEQAQAQAHDTSLLPLGESRALLQSVRGLAMTAISAALGGDARAEIAAELIMLALLSRLYCRFHSQTEVEKAANPDLVDESSLVGSLVVRVVGFQNGEDPRIAALKEVLDLFLPRCMQISCDAPTLQSSTSCLLPHKNYEADCVVGSDLQIGAGTVLLLDETVKTPLLSRTLMSRETILNGEKSARALRSLVFQQQLPVRFEYYDISVPMDIPIVILSSSPPISAATSSASPAATATADDSIFSADDEDEEWGSSSSGTVVSVRISALETISRDYSSFRSDLNLERAQLRLLRWWWSIGRVVPVSMGEEMITRAENDFVQARSSVRGVVPATAAAAEDALPTPPARTVGPKDMQRWITIARLLAQSHAEEVITEDHWERMRFLVASAMY